MIAIHEGRLDQLGRDRILPATEAEIGERIIENRQRTHGFQRARGAHVPMTRVEVERLSGMIARNHTLAGDNPYQAPQEDEAVAVPTEAPRQMPWWAGILSGFMCGALCGEIMSLIELPSALKQGAAFRELFVGFFVIFLAALGVIGAAIGIVAWFVHFAFSRLRPATEAAKPEA